MKWEVLVLSLLLLTSIHAEFQHKETVVNIIMGEDGTARVQEHVTFYVMGDYSRSQYISGLQNNDLSYWAGTTKISEMHFHLDRNVVNVQNIRVLPQTLKNCNPFLDLCHGEVTLDYDAKPFYNSTSGETIEKTGIFTSDTYKPRTARFTLNDRAFFFETTESGDVKIGENVILHIGLPENSRVTEVRPLPSSQSELKFPNTETEYEWTNVVLNRFTIVYEVEEGLDEEIVEFFSTFYSKFRDSIMGEYGFAVLGMVIILVGSYLALSSVKKKG
ncbi:hypothetical protein JXB01_02305 [Candidatus Micrarchaeota archaeon]|nr:hypothetical protein [Candidatus Micrarchaeota archaeon]